MGSMEEGGGVEGGFGVVKVEEKRREKMDRIGEGYGEKKREVIYLHRLFERISEHTPC